MADIVCPEKRSKMMAHISSHDTTPELYFRKLLYAAGIRYRLKVSSIIGHPDIYLPKSKTAIFIHGCYWHRHEHCKYAYNPKTNVAFWQNKFSDNVKRDKFVRKALYDQGVKILVIWECTIKRMKKDEVYKQNTMDSTIAFLQSEVLFLEL